MLGPFEQAVLLSIVRLGAAAYGRAIHTAVQEALNRTVAAGAVQATLDRLERKRLVSSRLAAGTPVRAGRARRYYAIAAPGARALTDAKAAADRIWRGVRWPITGEGRA